MPAFLSGLVLFLTLPPAVAEPADPATTLWYESPATGWQTEALPIGNGRLGAMIFGGVDRERIALNEESVWSGSRTNWNRGNASQNLPKIRDLLLAGKNDEAEALVNQTFTCTGGREQHQEVARQVAEAVKPGAEERGWTEYTLADGKAVKGARIMEIGDRAVLRHHLELAKEQLAGLGVLRIDASARNGTVHVNGEKVGELGGWQASGHDTFARDVGRLLKAGDNVIAIHCSNYRRRGQLPVAVSLEPAAAPQTYRRSLDLRDAVAAVRYETNGVTHTREAFASAPDEVMVFRFSAGQPGKISFAATLDRLQNFETRADGASGLLMTGNTASGQRDVEGMKFAARLHALNSGGKVTVEGDTLRVDAADEVVLLVAAATNYQGFAGRGSADPLQATADAIAREIKTAHARNANFLLNVGPDKQGRIIESSRKALAAIPAARAKAAD
jgi:alpha-L-fucosidase 2